MAKLKTNTNKFYMIIAMIPFVMCLISINYFLPNVQAAYITLGILTILSLFFMWKENDLMLSFTILFVLAVGCFAGATFIIDSMLKGIELVSGPQVGSFLFLEKQYGLINSKDALLALITLVATSTAVYKLVMRRRVAADEE